MIHMSHRLTVNCSYLHGPCTARYIFTKQAILSDVIAGLRPHANATAAAAAPGAAGPGQQAQRQKGGAAPAPTPVGAAAAQWSLPTADVEVMVLREWDVAHLPALGADKQQLWHGAPHFSDEYRLMVGELAANWCAASGRESWASEKRALCWFGCWLSRCKHVHKFVHVFAALHSVFRLLSQHAAARIHAGRLPAVGDALRHACKGPSLCTTDG